jgi:TonB family protein
MYRAGRSGVAEIRIAVDEQGTVSVLRTESASDDAFAAEAIRWLERIRFRPTLGDGHAVRVEFSVPFIFEVAGSGRRADEHRFQCQPSHSLPAYEADRASGCIAPIRVAASQARSASRDRNE